MAINSQIDALVGEGRYADAAAVAREAGEPARAAELYERIWQFADAAAAARDAGDLPRALRNAIDAKDEDLTGEIHAALTTDDEGRRAAAEVYAQRRRFSDAAELAEAVGDTEHAIEYYTNSHRDLDAARLLEHVGRDREAGRLLERLIETGDPGVETARAHLRLGKLLGRRMRHEPAARHLQEAARHDETRDEAQRSLIVALASMGLRDAARDVLIDARSRDASLPADIESYLRDARDEAAAATEERDDDGEQVIAGRYRLLELIGSGGSGRVFRARDEVGGRPVALKMFHTASARGHQAYERFVREARIAGSLRHPNLVEVFDFSAEHGFLVMEFMGGGSLADRLVKARMRGRAARRMVLDVLAGLELAHQRGVIHRDIKPANIFFDARGSAKLGDFGVAHLLDLGQTQTGGLIGTLAYMSPEQITGAPLTITADLYALGVTLFEALTGRLPFLGPDFVAQHLGETPPPPSEVGVDIAPGWDEVAERLLAKNPSERFGSVDELRRAVQQVELGETGPRPLVLPRADAAAASSGALPIQQAEEEPEEEVPRYQFETLLHKTSISRISRAVDTVLNRSVIIERFEPGALDPATEQRIYALARGGGAFVQRALAYDRDAGVAVFETATGTPIGEAYAAEPLAPRDAARLLKRLARAVAPLHEAQNAHGLLDEHHVLVDDGAIPAILAAGLEPIDPENPPTPAGDVAAILAIVAAAVRAEPTAESLLERLVPGLSRPERTAILMTSRARTGEELYAFADAVEIALLKASLRGRTRAS